ncbi:hypothetical protein ACHAWF_017221 [Thalassiosira exigua]
MERIMAAALALAGGRDDTALPSLTCPRSRARARALVGASCDHASLRQGRAAPRAAAVVLLEGSAALPLPVGPPGSHSVSGAEIPKGDAAPAIDLGSPEVLPAKEPVALQESIPGFVSGTAMSTVKTLIKYPLDTATVKLQMPDTKFNMQDLQSLFAGSFDVITTPLESNIPVEAIFFAVKDAAQMSLKESGLELPKWVSTSLAVGMTLPLYWAVCNPSKVVKTQLQVGAEGYYEGMSTLGAFRLALSDGANSACGGVGEIYQGYAENVLYGFPADIIKFVAYDYLTGGKGKGKKGVLPIDGDVYGTMSTAFTQLLTTPLDVLWNRIMAEVPVSGEDEDMTSNAKEPCYFDRLAKIAREEGLQDFFAGSTPRIVKAILSGARQSIVAVGTTLPLYCAVCNPSKVVKTRLQVGAEGYYEGMSTLGAFRLSLSDGANSACGGVGEMYQGYAENVLYGFPADITKFVAYNYLTGGKGEGKKGVLPIDGDVYGTMSMAFTQLLTTPLDVLWNRIKAEVPVSGEDEDVTSNAKEPSYFDQLAKIAREEGLQDFFAGSTPRIVKAILSGARQSVTYKETKQKLSELFLKR